MSGARLERLAAVIVCTVFITGCQTKITGGDGRPLPPKPRPAPEVPAGAVANRLTLLVAQMAEDSDGNGYPDALRASCALFAWPHPSSIHAEGAFVFTMHRLGQSRDPTAKPIAQWRFEPDQSRAAQARDLYGACYQFRFSLCDAGGDRMLETMGDLRAHFEPVDGGPIVKCSDEVRTVRVGRGAK